MYFDSNLLNQIEKVNENKSRTSVQSSPKKKLNKRNSRCIIKVQQNRGGFKVMGKRRNFYLSDLQLKRLNSMSKKMELSASDILRRAIDEYWERYEKKQKSK